MSWGVYLEEFCEQLIDHLTDISFTEAQLLGPLERRLEHPPKVFSVFAQAADCVVGSNAHPLAADPLDHPVGFEA